MLEQLGWLRLRPDTDPVKASERDIARDIAAAYRSRNFLAWTLQHNPGYAKTDYQLAMLGQKAQ